MGDDAALIAADWGTTSLRVFLTTAAGAILDRRASREGIMAVAGSRFEDALAAATADWPPGLPILLSGMIGSRQGWREAAYVAIPADAAAIAARLEAFETGLGTVRIIPGVAREDADWPDVMRGEETQILGALAERPGDDGVFVMPGTHAKWVRVADRRIVDFRTYLTGELFAAVKDHTIIGKLMAAPACATDAEAAAEPPGFANGLEAGFALPGAGALLGRLFSIRALGLFDRLAPEEAEGFLSGLLIGAEIADALARQPETAVTIIANERLSRRYATALEAAGARGISASPDCAAAGHMVVARAAGLIT